MKRMLILLLSLLAQAFSLQADQADSKSWNGAVDLLNAKIDSKESKAIFSQYGPATRMEANSVTEVDFKKSGLSLTAMNGRVINVTFQIAPGKKIDDPSYSGSTPGFLNECRNSPEDAIRVLGSPLKDTNKGYRQLVYSQGNRFMTLYYGPKLDFVSFSSKETERAGSK